MATGSVVVRELQETGKKKKATPFIKLILEGRLQKGQPSSDIFVVKRTRGDEGFNELMNIMGEHGLPFYKSSVKGKNQGPDGLGAKDDVVTIKVKSQWNKRGGTPTY